MSNSSKPGITLRTPNLILGQDLFTKLPQDMTKKDIENLYPILSQDDILAGTFQTLLPEEQKKMYDEVVDEQNIYQNLPPAKRSSEDAKQQSVAINHAKLNTIYFLTTHLFPLPSPTHLKKLSNITFNTIKDIDILNACIKKPEAGYLISYIIDLIPNSPTHYSFINDSNKHKSIDEIADSLINQALLAQTKHRKITQQAELYFNTLREQNTKTSSRQIPKPEPAKLPDPDAPPIPTKTYDTIPQRIIPESETEEYVNLPPLPHNKAKDLDVDEVYELIHQIEKELPLPARTKHTEHTTTSRNSQVPTFAPAAHMPNPIKPKLRMPLMPLQTEVDKPVTPASDSAAQKVSHFRSIVTPQIPQDTLDSISVRYPAANPETIQRFYNNLSLVTLSISRVHTLDDNRSLLDSLARKTHELTQNAPPPFPMDRKKSNTEPHFELTHENTYKIIVPEKFSGHVFVPRIDKLHKAVGHDLLAYENGRLNPNKSLIGGNGQSMVVKDVITQYRDEQRSIIAARTQRNVC